METVDPQKMYRALYDGDATPLEQARALQLLTKASPIMRTLAVLTEGSSVQMEKIKVDGEDAFLIKVNAANDADLIQMEATLKKTAGPGDQVVAYRNGEHAEAVFSDIKRTMEDGTIPQVPINDPFLDQSPKNPFHLAHLLKKNKGETQH